MSFRKPCHMPFRKLIPPFTLTDVRNTKKSTQAINILNTNQSAQVINVKNNIKI